MVSRIAILILLTSSAVSGAIDLTPLPFDYETEGIPFRAIAFHDNARQVIYNPPTGWRISGSARLLRLESPAASEVATIELACLEAPLTVAQENIRSYGDLAATLVPAGAADIEVVGSTVDPMRISGHPTVEVTLGYTRFGQAYRMNVLFLTRAREQIRFTVTAKASEFASALTVFRNSLYSMQGL